jgi:hypothetical protein
MFKHTGVHLYILTKDIPLAESKKPDSYKTTGFQFHPKRNYRNLLY